ncbi:heavy metal translocating P-type ATPase [Desulfofalx alkaliphila]|uniref:heavy metal translocating P-type ATPase n=1 Tax=Desulfofalx alkaliphila TaxID=105483 RepID=UPI00068C85E3|nr:heavy metal translocating P-type ATPase [Desulfofalx alkaliphila]
MSDIKTQKSACPGGENCSCREAVVSDTLILTGLDCADCAAKLDKSIAALDGVVRSAVNFTTAKLRVDYRPGKLHRGDLVRHIEKLGYGVAKPKSDGSEREDLLRLTGLDCADCAAKLQKAVEKMPGVQEAAVNFGAGTLKIKHTGDIDGIINSIRQMGYGAVADGLQHSVPAAFWIQNRRVLTTLISGLFVMAGFLTLWLDAPQNYSIVLFSLAIVAGGYYPARAGLYSLSRGFSMDMNVLMIIAVLGAVGIGQWEEAATVIFLFSLGNALETYSMEKTRNSIRGLMQLAPETALVKREGKETVLPVSEVEVGDLVIVRPGERLPVDGKIICGQTAINQAPITGESMPVDKSPGDEVFAGTINGNGSIEVQVTKLVRDTTLARIINMVEEAQEQKAPSQRFVDIFARYYTPVVITLAVLVAAVPPLLFAEPFSPWFYKALTLLVVSCPCALVISTPVSVVSAIGNAARHGVLIKGGAYLEQAGAIKAVAFDKTGTLTLGRPEVTDVIAMPGNSKEEVLGIAAAVEVRSEHPLAEAVLRQAKKANVNYSIGEHFVALVGKGAKAKVEGQNYYVGNPMLFGKDLKHDLQQVKETMEQLQAEGKTAVLVGCKSNILGIIAVADRVRESSSEAIKQLKDLGVQPIMLTGDNRGTAEAIAKSVGIDELKANLLPQDKVRAIKGLQQRHRRVAMVGDGVNDAPALATANLGIAMGGTGTDVALETSDIALMSDDPTRVAYLIKLSKGARGIIKQNIAFSLLVKLAAVTLVFPGILNLWMAIMADTGAALLVILNGMRLLRVKP